MRFLPSLRRAALVGLPLTLAAATLLVPVEAHDSGHAAGTLPLVRYACGNRITQVYSHPPADKAAQAPVGSIPISWVQALTEKQVPLGDAGCKLRPRLVARLCAPAGTGFGQKARGTIRERLAIYEFDVLYDNLPVSHASRTVVVRDGRAVAIRDRNSIAGMQKPAGGIDVSQEAAWTVAFRNARETFTGLYRAAPSGLVADAEPLGGARLVLWPDAREKKMQTAWNLTVRSTSRGRPFIRRYWVAAQQPARLLDFEDLVFYQAPITGPRGRTPLFGTPLFGTPLFGTPSPALNPQTAPLAPRSTADTPSAQAAAGSYTAVFQGPISGTVTAAVWEGSPYGSVVTRPLYGLDINVHRPGDGGQLVRTDAYGRYQAAGVQGLATVRCNLTGHACQVINDQTVKQDHALYSARMGVGTVNVDFPAHHGEEFKLAQTSAYYHVTRAFEFVKDCMPERPVKLTGLKTHVNINDTCNAYYDRSDTTLNFFRAGKECPNTAYRDVIYHEYGHAVDDELGGVLDGAYSEGFGDALANMMTRSPHIATDFYGPGKHLRDSRRVVLWPSAKDGEIHTTGQVYSGFCWELMQQLQLSYPQDQAYEVARQLILGAAVQNPKDIPDAVRLSFYVDSQLYPSTLGESVHARHLRAAARSRQLPIPQDARHLTSPMVN